MRWVPIALLPLAIAFGCGDADDDDGADEPQPVFPEDYESTYTEVRNCRGSGDHDLNNIRVLADPAAVTPYQDHVDPFPEGSVVLKVEYDFGDTSCEGDPIGWTAMQRLATGSSPDTLDWTWQEVDMQRRVIEENGPACIGCHTACGGNAPPGFPYESTCTAP